MRLQVTPLGLPGADGGVVAGAAQPRTPTGARPGRKPGPATAALTQAMLVDATAGKQRSRQEYLRVLREAGHGGSEASALLIVAREAKRAFGRPLGRAPGKRTAGGRKGGRKSSPATDLLRQRLAEDKAAGRLQDARHYIRWLVDQPGVTAGIKVVRPVVYRELRAVRQDA